MSVARVKAYRRGVFAEKLAALLFRLKGYRIVAQRYRSPVGEIDLVAQKGKRLVFVEVKRRKTADDAAWTLPAKQRRRIVRAAQYWLASHPDFTGHSIAFDVVLCCALDLAPACRERISRLTSAALGASLRGEILKSCRNTDVSQSRLSDGPDRAHRYQGRFHLRAPARSTKPRP